MTKIIEKIKEIIIENSSSDDKIDDIIKAINDHEKKRKPKPGNMGGGYIGEALMSIEEDDLYQAMNNLRTIDE